LIAWISERQRQRQIPAPVTAPRVALGVPVKLIHALDRSGYIDQLYGAYGVK